MDTNAKRNRDICKLLDTKKVSYAVIAQMMRTTRSAVAGVAFRRRYPYKVRVSAPGHALNKRNKIGHGFQPATYQPKKTIHVAL